MHTDWNFVLNLLLFIGVLVAIGKIIKGKNKYANSTEDINSQDLKDEDIIAVRKIHEQDIDSAAFSTVEDKLGERKNTEDKKDVVLFLLAKDGEKFSGFDLLHTLLAQGLRYGEKQLFHYYKDNGEGSHAFSLAAATTEGTFDLSTIKEFSVSGLCLFFKPTGDKQLDTKNFRIMYETALKLSETLNAHILDERQNVLNDDGILRYYQAF